MKKELVTECFRSKYNVDVFKRGVPGFADFIIEEFIIDNKASYYSTDRSRNRLMMTDEDGNEIEDPNCDHLLALVAPGMARVTEVYEACLFEKHHDFTEEDIHTNYLHISRLDTDRNKFCTEISKRVPSKNLKKSIVDDENWRDSYRQMQLVYKKNHDTCTNKHVEEIPVLQTIGNYSLGYLSTFRKKYQDLKLQNKHADITGPADLIKLCQSDPDINTKYISYITS